MPVLPTLASLFDLTGKVAVVTGGSRGLGLEMAEALGEAGCRLLINSRKPAELAEAEAYLRGRGWDCQSLAGSVAEPAACEAIVTAALEHYGRIDILVNNAGTSWGAPLAEHPLERFEYVMKVNASGTWLLSQLVVRQMLAQGGEGYSIINVASVAGVVGSAGDVLQAPGYVASKHAVVGLTRYLGSQLAAQGIRCNALAPGWFPTRMSKGLLSMVGEAGLSTGVPMGRIGRPGELKGAILFLASPASSYMTGQVLCIDGGQTAV